MDIKNYIIKHNDAETVILTELEGIKDFPFKDSNLYISKKRIEDKVLFIMTPNQSHKLKFINVDVQIIQNIVENNSFSLGLIDPKGNIVDGYKYDIKIIK